VPVPSVDGIPRDPVGTEGRDDDDHEERSMPTGRDEPHDDRERTPSASDGAASEDRSSEQAEPTPASQAEPQPN